MKFESEESYLGKETTFRTKRLRVFEFGCWRLGGAPFRCGQKWLRNGLLLLHGDAGEKPGLTGFLHKAKN